MEIQPGQALVSRYPGDYFSYYHYSDCQQTEHIHLSNARIEVYLAKQAWATDLMYRPSTKDASSVRGRWISRNTIAVRNWWAARSSSTMAWRTASGSSAYRTNTSSKEKSSTNLSIGAPRDLGRNIIATGTFGLTLIQAVLSADTIHLAPAASSGLMTWLWSAQMIRGRTHEHRSDRPY